VAQTPRVGSPYGAECRALFHAGDGLVLVGCDAEGIELRMLAHYMAKWDGGAYAETVANGRKEDGTDVHTVNRKAIGLRLRDSAKTFCYALIYGAGDFKLGTIVYDDFDDEKKARFDAAYRSKGQRQRAFVKLGKSRRSALMTNLPALGQLVEAVKAQAAKKGYLRGLDGRLLHVRAAHSALNTLLQSGGAVVMKKALVLLDEALDLSIRSTGAIVEFVANVHDEWQMETTPEVADDVGKLAADAIVRAGVHFGLRCPLAGSYGVGKTWADTH
jgi:DNA polymerase-1